MNNRRLISLTIGALLAVTTAIAAVSGSALAAAPNVPATGITCDNVGCCEPSVVVNGAAPADISICESPSPTAEPTATPLPTCGVEDHVVVNGGEQTSEPCPTATPLPSCYQVSAVNGGVVDSSVQLCATATPVVTATPIESVGGETATPFESVGGETATPAITTPPTNTGSGPGNTSAPLMALLICLAFGAIGLAAVEAQRRSANR